MATMQRPGALGGLALEEKDAWAEYLDATLEVSECRYDEVEPWAWARLSRRLQVIQQRRKALEEEDGA